MVKPIGRKTQKTETKPKQTVEQPKKVKIGGVIFDSNQIEADKTTSYVRNGQRINTVFVKPGVQIDFPDQKNSKKHPEVQSLGLSDKWYNPDYSNINITDLDNAKIYGNPNKTDFITLEGFSSNNEIFVDQPESWYVDGNQQKDHVELYSDTSNNIVHQDDKDKTQIWYNQTGVEVNGKTIQSTVDCIEVKGEGESAQEQQLKGSLSNPEYQEHKWTQQFDYKKYRK